MECQLSANEFPTLSCRQELKYQHFLLLSISYSFLQNSFFSFFLYSLDFLHCCWCGLHQQKTLECHQHKKALNIPTCSLDSYSNHKTRIQVPGEKKFEPWYLLSLGFHFLCLFRFGVLFFFNKVLVFLKKIWSLCYENRIFHKQLPLSWKGIYTEQCPAHPESSRLRFLHEPHNHSRTEKDPLPLALIDLWAEDKQALFAEPSLLWQRGGEKLICVSNMCLSKRNKKQQFACGLGSLEPSVLCGKLQGASEHPFMLRIPKLKHFTLADNFEIFISIHLC